jgi:subtilisin family serine protease
MKDFPLEMKHSSGVTMKLERDRVLVALKPSAEAARRRGVLDEMGLVEEGEVAHRGAGKKDVGARPMTRINQTATRVWARTKDGSAFAIGRAAKLHEDKDSPLDWVGPVYSTRHESNTQFLSLMPHTLLVKRADDCEEKDFVKRLGEHGLTKDVERSKYLGSYDLFNARDPLDRSAVELLPELMEAEAERLREVRFETMPMIVPTAYVPNDTLFTSQWGMEQIEAGGSGQTAWNLNRGDPSVVICVLDEGCDLTHPDMDYHPDGLNLETMLTDGSPTGDHGTACAGIAAARIENTEGVAGVAGGCTVLPVAFGNWTDVEVAIGIRYAALKGARVISMSFGWNLWDHNVIDPAIQDAFDADVVMCVATHNYNSAITYPATNPLVMACGASDQADDRKTPASPDGEYWWGSDFGPEMSVVAPGVLIPTTDRTGTAGYNPSGGSAGDYVMNFNGTSSATPHVAGLAGLLLSAKPTLTNVEVRDLIEQTADKVGSVPYATVAGYPNGTWNEEMGYGRINAYRALQTVCKSLLVDFKHYITDHKLHVVDEFHKLERYKEKERLEEVKSPAEYENPLLHDPSIYERIIDRLQVLERKLDAKLGKHFIGSKERPEVGSELSRQAKPTPKKKQS